MVRIEPEFWVDRPGEAVDFYTHAFGARVLHRVGDGDDIVAQLAVGDAPFGLPPMVRASVGSAHSRSMERQEGRCS